MPYFVAITPAAGRDLKKLTQPIRERILLALAELKIEPRPHGAIKLTRSIDTYRIRVGDYRVLYEIHDDRLLVLVLHAGHRRDVYRK